MGSGGRTHKIFLISHLLYLLDRLAVLRLPEGRQAIAAIGVADASAGGSTGSGDVAGH